VSAWFRAYSETLNDAKVQTLPLEAFKAWHNCLYLAALNNSKDGNIGNVADVSFAFRETKETVSSAFHTLVEHGLLATVGETFQIKNWRKRQYKSDVSTERVKRFRKRCETVSETAPDTDTDTDNTLSKDSGVAADSDKEFWASAKSYLGGKNPGSIIGKWCRDYPKKEVAKAIGAAQVERAVDPVPYIERVLRGVSREGIAIPL
jgi:hypothetical protein